MILIYPPVTKSCEPPAGVALLSGALKEHGIESTIIDANIEALLWLGQSSFQVSGQASNNHHPNDSWTKRALSHYNQNLSDLKSLDVYQNMGRYRQRLMDINRVITTALPERFKVTLADYRDSQLLPVKSCDLLESAEKFTENPFFNYFETYLVKRIEKSRFDHVGISLCFLSQALTSFALAGWVKSRFPQKKIIMGGGLVTSWMSSPEWNNPFDSLIDIMVKGEGEKILVEIVAGAELTRKIKRKINVKAKNNVETKTSVKIKNSYLPDFDFCKWELYLAPGRVLPYRASIGCYWGKCRFCPERAEAGRYRTGKNKKIIDELKLLHYKYDIDYVHFLDNALSPSFLKALTWEESIPFLWYGFARFSKELADPLFCSKLYRSGCRMLKLGLESGDQTVLERMSKGTDLDTASLVLSSLKDAGIAAYVYLLFGTSFENEAAAEKTLVYVAEHSDRISFLNTAIFNLPRFSEDAANLETGMFYEGDLSLYSSFKHPEQWERKKVRRFLDKKFKKNSFIAPVLRNDPPFFSSNHAMFVKPAWPEHGHLPPATTKHKTP
ncbi:MAG: radical SAM protein [Thermodesulfobacteriota bacterium]|nr:radical SAM protein [Thermodesulfobacteriota bacterium]